MTICIIIYLFIGGIIATVISPAINAQAEQHNANRDIGELALLLLKLVAFFFIVLTWWWWISISFTNRK